VPHGSYVHVLFVPLILLLRHITLLLPLQYF
jgi:hypothetical protein